MLDVWWLTVQIEHPQFLSLKELAKVNVGVTVSMDISVLLATAVIGKTLYPHSSPMPHKHKGIM